MTSIRPSNICHRVSLYNADAEPIAVIWASIEPIKYGKTSHVITVRNDKKYERASEIRFGTRVFNVDHVDVGGEKKDYLHFHVKELEQI